MENEAQVTEKQDNQDTQKENLINQIVNDLSQLPIEQLQVIKDQVDDYLKPEEEPEEETSGLQQGEGDYSKTSDDELNKLIGGK